MSIWLSGVDFKRSMSILAPSLLYEGKGRKGERSNGGAGDEDGKRRGNRLGVLYEKSAEGGRKIERFFFGGGWRRDE